jgi:uncharacterized protein (DUF1330 family)
MPEQKPAGGPVHVVVDVEIRDRDLFLEYAAGHVPSLERYGGKILFRSFDLEAVDGDWSPTCLVVHESPSAQAFGTGGFRRNTGRADMRRQAASIRLVIAHQGF